MSTTEINMIHYCKYLGYLKKAYDYSDDSNYNDDIQKYISYLKKKLND